VPACIGAQTDGAFAGIGIADVMFEKPAFFASSKRSAGAFTPGTQTTSAPATRGSGCGSATTRT
jgi:hypothetical protein